MSTTAPAEQPKSRRALPVVLIVLATMIAIASVFALWAKRQLLETQTWETTSEELIEDADIQDALATFLVTALYDNVDVEATLAERLPPDLAPLAGPAAGALRGVADDVTLKALEQPKVQQLFVQASSVSQEKLIDLIEDEGQFVSTSGGVVTLDLTSLLESVTSQLGVGSKVVAKLPPQAGSIEIMQSDELEAAQKAVNALQTAAWVLTALALILYAVAIWLAGARRRQTLRAVGVSFIVVGVVVLLARGAGGNAVVGSLSETGSTNAAVESAYEIGTSLMKETGQSILIYGIVIVLCAWLAGPTSWATSIRRAITPYLRQPRFAYGALALLLALLFWWDPVIATHRFVPSLLLIGFAVLGVEMLRRQVIREFPDHVTTGSPAGIAQGIAARMREGRERRVAGAGAGAPADPRLADLERLAGLRDAGVLSDEELAAEKARILGT
jgi:hypothetical protein